jgi:hypothetical protein
MFKINGFYQENENKSPNNKDIYKSPLKFLASWPYKLLIQHIQDD